MILRSYWIRLLVRKKLDIFIKSFVLYIDQLSIPFGTLASINFHTFAGFFVIVFLVVLFAVVYCWCASCFRSCSALLLFVHVVFVWMECLLLYINKLNLFRIFWYFNILYIRSHSIYPWNSLQTNLCIFYKFYCFLLFD